MELTNWKSIQAKLGLATIGKPALIGLAAVLVMVAVIAGRIVIDAATATEITIEHNSVEENNDPSEESIGCASSELSKIIYVHVSGAVKNPGLVKLDQGSRIADAINAAGGFSKNADEGSINLARKVDDGEQIQVYELGSKTTGYVDEPLEKTASNNQELRININTATDQELQNLPGIGPAIALKIVEYRDANGPFSEINELKNVSGIGDKKFETIASLICV